MGLCVCTDYLLPMASTQIPVWEHVFNFTSIDIPSKTVSLLSRHKFDGEGKLSAREHVLKFSIKCDEYKITDLGLTCRLFALTLGGRIEKWLETFPSCSFYTWFEFANQFLDDFEDYDYDK